MSNLPEVASSPTGLEVDHSADVANVQYAAPHYANQYQPLPMKSDGPPVNAYDATPQTQKTICGVPRSTFWLAIILGIVIVGAAVGGGVGGSLAVSNARSASQSASPTPSKETVTVTATSCVPTPTSTSDTEPPYVPKAPSEVLRINNTCPSPTVNSSGIGDIPSLKFSCEGNTNIGGSDIVWVVAYTLQACIDACSNYNKANVTDRSCKGAALAQDMSHQFDISGGANCWLKYDLETNPVVTDNTITLLRLQED